jgi:hypothetical protein
MGQYIPVLIQVKYTTWWDILVVVVVVWLSPPPFPIVPKRWGRSQDSRRTALK